jgi:Putative transposase
LAPDFARYLAPSVVLAYLGRYTHRVTISNSRLIALVDGQVSFRWRPSRRIHSCLTAVRTRR